MPHWNNQPWQRNLNKTASGKTGAVQLFSGAASDARAISPPGWRGAQEGPGLIGLHQARLS